MKNSFLCRNLLVLACCALTLGLSSIAQADLINGGFEDPFHTANNGTNPVGWTVIETTLGTNPDRQIRTRNQNPESGSMALQVGAGNSNHTGQLWQSCATEIGQLYEFTISARSAVNGTSGNNNDSALQNFNVDILDGNGLGGTLLSSVGSAGSLNNSYQAFTTTFTATSTFTTVHISDVSTAIAGDGNDVLLDNVSKVAVAVPEPTSACLLGMAFLGMAVRRRR